MGLMESFLGSLKINEEGIDDGGDYYDEVDSPEEVSRVSSKTEQTSEEPRKTSFAPRTNSAKNRKLGNGMEVCVIKPVSTDDAREIIDTLLSNHTVVLNVEGLDIKIAQRIIDFSSGAAYAMSGNFQKISNFIFIITPQSVDISGDFSSMLNDSFDVPEF